MLEDYLSKQRPIKHVAIISGRMDIAQVIERAMEYSSVSQIDILFPEKGVNWNWLQGLASNPVRCVWFFKVRHRSLLHIRVLQL